MNKLKYIILLFATVFVFNSCDADEEERTTVDYITFESDSFAFPVDLGSSNSYDITIYASQISNLDRTFNVNVIESGTSADPASYTVPSTFTILANSNVGTLNVSVSDVNISGSGETLVIGFSETQELQTGGNITLNIKQVCPVNDVFLNITFDGWPEEIYWVLEDSSANVIAESAPGAYGAYSGLTGGTTANFCLPDGDYTFTIYDQYGDGAGPFSFTLDGNILFESDGGYGPGTAIDFTL